MYSECSAWCGILCILIIRNPLITKFSSTYSIISMMIEPLHIQYTCQFIIDVFQLYFELLYDLISASYLTYILFIIAFRLFYSRILSFMTLLSLLTRLYSLLSFHSLLAFFSLLPFSSLFALYSLLVVSLLLFHYCSQSCRTPPHVRVCEVDSTKSIFFANKYNYQTSQIINNILISSLYILFFLCNDFRFIYLVHLSFYSLISTMRRKLTSLVWILLF